MYMLKSVGDSTPPCGTLFLNWRCVDVLFLNVFVLCVLCLIVLVNCLLNVFAICVGEVSVLSLKVMVLFVGILLASPCIVFQRVCVLCL